MCLCVGVVLCRGVEDEVEGRRKDRTGDIQMLSTKRKYRYSRQRPACPANPIPSVSSHGSFFTHGGPGADSAGLLAACSRSVQLPGERQAISSPGSVPPALWRRDTGGVGVQRRGPSSSCGGQSRRPRRGAIPLSPGTSMLPGWHSWQWRPLWTSALEGLRALEAPLPSRHQLCLIC